MNNWIWPTLPASWVAIKKGNVWGVRKEGQGKRVQEGDKIIFYVNTAKKFQGIYKVKSLWHKPKFPWMNYGEKGVVAETDLEVVQLGYANVHDLQLRLNFVKSHKNLGLALRGSRHGPANNGNPISDDDYKLILEELGSRSDVVAQPLTDLSYHSNKYQTVPQPEKISIMHIVNCVSKGKFAIPDFQRDWLWKKKQIEELWESIFQGYYMGSLLTWKPMKQNLGKVPIKHGPELTEDPDLILDGQQRITAIYYAKNNLGEPIEENHRSRKFFLNISALDPNSDAKIIDSYVKAKVENENLNEEEIQYQKKIFPLEKLGQNYQWLRGFEDHLINNEGHDEKHVRNYASMLNTILDYVWLRYEIPVVKLSNDLSLEDVATIFERINRMGTRLGSFDLLNARLAKYDIIIKKEWESIEKNHRRIKELHRSMKDMPLFIPRALSLSKTGLLKEKNILNLDEQYKMLDVFQKDKFLDDWKKMAQYIEESLERIALTNNGGFGAVKNNLIPYKIMIPMLAAFLKEIHKKPNQPAYIDKIKFWYWNSIIGDRYSKSSDTSAQTDFKLMKNWFNGNDSVIEELKKERNDYKAKKNTGLYNAVICAMAKQDAYDFRNGNHVNLSKLEIHHIFPKSKKEELGAGDEIDSCLNMALISKESNTFFGDRYPSEYLCDIKNEQNIKDGKLQERLSTHLISPVAFGCLMINDFKGFIKEREKTIGEYFKELAKPPKSIK